MVSSCNRRAAYCMVMLIRNLARHHGLCNGTRLVVLTIRAQCLTCVIASGSERHVGKTVPLRLECRMLWDTSPRAHIRSHHIPRASSRWTFPACASTVTTKSARSGCDGCRRGLGPYRPHPRRCPRPRLSSVDHNRRSRGSFRWCPHSQCPSTSRSLRRSRWWGCI